MSTKKSKNKKHFSKNKPFVVEWRGDPETANGLFQNGWIVFKRYKTRNLALGAITEQLLKSNLFLFHIRGENTVYCRGY